MASELEDGTYVILNSANTSLALDSKGATDGNNANVQLWTRNDSDAQLVRVWTRSDGTRKLCFAGTGKCVDVTGNKVAVGANVAQHDDNDSAAQQWTISALDGETTTIGGTSYQLYKVYLTETGTQYLMEVYGTGTPASGANVCVSTDELTSADQKWAFVPMNPVATGTYAIRPRVNMTCALDVQGSSHAIGARVIISGEHLGSGPDHGNNQVVWLREYDSNGRAKMEWVHSGLLCEIFDTNTAKSGTAVCQCDDYGGTDQQWVIAPHGSATWNGVSVPLYTIRNYAATGTLMMDVCGGSSTPGTYLQVYPQNNSAAQDFFFQPVEAYGEDIAAPSIIGMADQAGIGSATAYGTSKSANDPDAATTEWKAAWRGEGTQWQARYRYRTQAPEGEPGAWSDWLSMADGSKSNGGWGTTWVPNVVTDESSSNVGPAFTLPSINGTDRDYADVQVEARRFSADHKGKAGLMAHGPSDVKDVKLLWKPSLTSTTATLGPAGLTIAYAIDYKHGGNAIEVASLKGADGRELLASNATHLRTTGLGRSGSIVIPWSDMVDAPTEGEEVAATLVVTTKDGGQAEAVKALPVAYEATKADLIHATTATTDRYTIGVGMPAHDEDSAYIVQGGRNDSVALEGADDGKREADAVPALGSSARVLIVSRNGTEWDYEFVEVAGLDDGAYVWNWTDEDGTRRAAVMRYEFDEPITQQDSWKAECSELVTTGRPLPSYKFGKSATRDLGVSGKLMKRWMGPQKWASEGDFVALLRAHHVLFRNRFGGVHHVAITGVDITRTYDEYTSVSVSQNEETL